MSTQGLAFNLSFQFVIYTLSWVITVAIFSSSAAQEEQPYITKFTPGIIK